MSATAGHISRQKAQKRPILRPLLGLEGVCALRKTRQQRAVGIHFVIKLSTDIDQMGLVLRRQAIHTMARYTDYARLLEKCFLVHGIRGWRLAVPFSVHLGHR